MKLTQADISAYTGISPAVIPANAGISPAVIPANAGIQEGIAADTSLGRPGAVSSVIC